MHTMLEDYGVEIDGLLIDEFRDKVNLKPDFVEAYFSNRQGKNQLSVLHSCMDWLTVSIRYIQNYPELSDDIDIKAMQIYSLISSIDIIGESVRQLHRVLVGHSEKKWPFKNSNTIFKEKVEYLSHRTDDSYFAEIRAIFGAHPTNLHNTDTDERLFASWPYTHSSHGFDFTVNISSNIVGKEDVVFGFRIAELLNYAKERFEYISVLTETMDKHYEVCRAQLKRKNITKTENVHDELAVLRDAAIDRFNNEYYRYTIDELIRLFSVTVSEPHLQEEERKFKAKLLPLIAEIRLNLQTMNLVDLVEDVVFVGRLPERALSYELPKLFSVLHSNRYDPLIDYYVKQLNKYSSNKYRFSVQDGDRVMLLKLRMMTFTECERVSDAV
ncbi:hypothetical protein I5678_17015 [Citrobacter freundii]|nr:hypothetical protein [Citrobacter freundii]